MAVSVVGLVLFFVVYAVVHSLLASLGVKKWARQWLGPGTDRWYRLAYNLFAVISLLPILPLIVLLPDKTLYIVAPPWRWLMVGGQVLALIGLVTALLQTDPWHFLGLSQLVARQSVGTGSLNVTGCYGWVRHPLYSFSILFLWLTPAMTVNLLTVFVLFTLYFYVGSIYEERRLLAEFGQAYREYQQRVPRLIPFPRSRPSLTPR